MANIHLGGYHMEHFIKCKILSFFQEYEIGQGQTVAKEERQLRSAEETAARSVATEGVPATPIKPSEKVRHVHIPISGLGLYIHRKPCQHVIHFGKRNNPGQA